MALARLADSAHCEAGFRLEVIITPMSRSLVVTSKATPFIVDTKFWLVLPMWITLHLAMLKLMHQVSPQYD